jgi:flagellar hook-basal body complex protein FliE
MSIPAIAAVGFTPMTPPAVGMDTVSSGAGAIGGSGSTTGTTGTTGVASTSGDFGNLVTQGLDKIEAVNNNVDQLAVKAATGDLNNIHDYTIAATEASVTTQLTAAVRNKALEAFNEIMRMQV